MSEPFLAEIRMVGFNFPPRGWAFCDGQILPINQNQSLYSLVGTTYGGDGRTTFALPDLRGRTPIHRSGSHGQGERDGAETHPLTVDEMPVHTHQASASGDQVTTNDPTGNVLGQNAGTPYRNGGTEVTMGASSLSRTGGGQAHDNMQPFLAVEFCIALQGLFPSRN